MGIYNIPVRGDIPHYAFSIELELNRYQMEFRWNDRAKAWVFSMYADDGRPLLSGQRVLPGVDMLKRFRYRTGMPKGSLLVMDTERSGVPPYLTELGKRVQVVYVDSTEAL